MPIRAPIRVPISSGAIVVLQSLAPATTGSAVFTYQVVGDYYRWYETIIFSSSFGASMSTPQEPQKKI